MSSTPRSIHRLSALSVARLKKPGHYGDGGGLYLQVSVSRTRSWVYRLRREGRLRDGAGATACRLASRCTRTRSALPHDAARTRPLALAIQAGS